MNFFIIFLYALVVTASTSIVTADDSTSKISDLEGTTEKSDLTTPIDKNSSFIEDVTIIDHIVTTEKIETLKEDVTIAELNTTSQEITDFSTTPTEESVTLKESEDGKNDTSNGTIALDQSENGEDNDTSITNPRKRHVYPLPLDSFRHPYIGYYGESQNVESVPADVPFDPNFVNYYPHNRGYADTIPGTEGRDYPIFATVPQTQFSCNNLPIGLYGDVEARCQVWHFCQDGGRKDSFLCPNGTLFNQQVLVCDWWYNVECESTPQFYSASSQTHQSGQYYGVRYSQGTAYYPPGFGTNKGTSHSGASQYIPAQPTKRTSSYASAVTQTAYQTPRATYQNSREKGSGYYAPSVPAQPSQVIVECKQQGNQCSGASYTIKESKGDTGVGYGVQSVQTGYAPAGNVKSGYQYSYSGQSTAVPNTGYSYSYQTGISTPAMQAIRFEPQYTTGGQSGYQYSYSNKASSDTGYQYANQNKGATPGFQYQSVSRVTPSFQVNYEVPVQYPSDQSGFQYSYSTHGTGADQTGYQNTFASQSSGVKSGYQYPAPATGRRVPGTKSGYQYSYSTQVGKPGSSHVQSFSSSYDGQKSAYQQPIPVPAPTPAPVRVTANVKSGYEYTVQPAYEYKPAPTPAPVRVANVKSGYQYQSVSVPAPAPVRVTNVKSDYQYQSAPAPAPTPAPVRVTNVKSGYQYQSAPAPAPVPVRVTNVKSDYQYETAPAPAPVRVTNVKSGYQYQSAPAPAPVPVRVTNVKSDYQYETAPAPAPVSVTNVKSGYQYQSAPAPAPVPVRVTNVKSDYQYETAPSPTPVRVTNVKSGYQYQSTPAPVRVSNVKSSYEYQAGLTPAPAPVTNVKSGYVQPIVYQFQPAPTPAPVPVPVRVVNVKSGYDYSPQIPRVQPNYEYGVSQNQDSDSGEDSGYGYGQTVVQNIPRGGGRCANCYGASDAGFGAVGRAFVASTVRPITTPYPSSDEEQDPQIQY